MVHPAGTGSHSRSLDVFWVVQGGFSAATDLLAAAGLLPARLEPRASLALGSVLLIRSRASASPSALLLPLAWTFPFFIFPHSPVAQIVCAVVCKHCAAFGKGNNVEVVLCEFAVRGAGKPRGAHSEDSSVLEVQYRVEHSPPAAVPATEVASSPLSDKACSPAVGAVSCTAPQSMATAAVLAMCCSCLPVQPRTLAAV